MEFTELINKRHSKRAYSSEEIPQGTLDQLIHIANMAPSSRNKKPCRFMTIKGKQSLEILSQAKESGSQMIKDAAAAILVMADATISDVWIEDASVAMTYLHLAATDFGIGSCWVQIRNRKSADGTPSDQFIKNNIYIEDNLEILGIISLGFPKNPLLV